jgi:hypothetical protein
MDKAQPDPNRRFQAALDRARAEWLAADPVRSAVLAGCICGSDGISVPFFGRPHVVTHPGGEVCVQKGSGSAPAHPSVAIVLLHYLLTADGSRPADRWVTFRDLPDGLFYAQAFAGHAEAALAGRFGADIEAFRQASAGMRGAPLDLADASYRFQALPRVALAVLVWEGDDEVAAQARILFDADAGHYLATEDLSGLGEWLAHRLGA